jgi:putative FmdB family regulatory protein
MPVYTYRCTNCGVQFDKQLSFTDLQPTRCPECGKKTLMKIFQPVGIVFKGSGFYATDHHSPSGQSPKKDERDRKESGESKESEAKAEKIPEKKEDSGNKEANKEATTKTEKGSEKKE